MWSEGWPRSPMAILDDHAQEWKHGHLIGPLPEGWQEGRALPPESRFPCFSKGSCMNQPLVYHNYTDIEDDTTLKGDSTGHGISMLMSPRGWTIFLIIQWLGRRRSVKADGNSIMCSRLPQWLMLYLRSDATNGYPGGYHYPTRGMDQDCKICPSSYTHFCSFSSSFSLLIYLYKSILYD